MDQFAIPGITVKNHKFRVPLDHHKPAGETIQVFAREVVAVSKSKQDLPWLVFFQGGPGFEGNAPTGKSGWLKPALKEFRVLILDQRGTGQSQPFDLSLVNDFTDDQSMADYLCLFRADQIVKDAEWIRKEMAIDQWSLLGQSYGGFCIYTYLSFHSDAVREAMLTGGIPPVGQTPEQVYRATHQRMLVRNQDYFRRYPEDRNLCQKIVTCLQENEVALPCGARLTPQRFQQLGLLLGGSGGMETVHYLLEQAFPDERFIEPSFRFLQHIETATDQYQTNPFYAILHESIYCEGQASQWAAWQVQSSFPQFDALASDEFHFTGEVIYPFMFDQYPGLQPLKGAAEILAKRSDWPKLYDVEALKKSQVPCAAAVYEHDIYVEREFSLASAKLIENMKVWTTSEYEHNGLRVDPGRIFTRLLNMNRGEI